LIGIEARSITERDKINEYLKKLLDDQNLEFEKVYKIEEVIMILKEMQHKIIDIQFDWIEYQSEIYEAQCAVNKLLNFFEGIKNE
jgi:hypothetical protein